MACYPGAAEAVKRMLATPPELKARLYRAAKERIGNPMPPSVVEARQKAQEQAMKDSQPKQASLSHLLVGARKLVGLGGKAVTNSLPQGTVKTLLGSSLSQLPSAMSAQTSDTIKRMAAERAARDAARAAKPPRPKL